jgi:beta-1,4-mannosyl-glycoprotein beta-1,4-N-acetylglucosaminyltransferase
MLDYRLTTLENVVDYFVIVESTRSFMGNPKPLFFEENKHRFEKFKDRIIHIVVDDFPFENPDKKQVWKNEEFQRNSIDRGLQQLNLNPDDFIIISDIDEIPDPCTLNIIKLQSNLEVLSQFEQDFYYYNLNNRLPYLWYSSKIFKYKLLKSNGIQEIRLSVLYGIKQGGWHLSYFGEAGFISNKIKNFSHQEFNSEEYTNTTLINYKINNNIDIFDRPIKLLPSNGYLPPNYHKVKNYCFIHSCNTADLFRLDNLLNKISNLNFEKIFINNIGKPIEKEFGENIVLTNYSTDISLFECPTINELRDFSKKNKNCNLLYLHTKGTGHSKDSKNINDWIDMMLYFLVERYPVPLKYLEKYDTVGCNYHTYNSSRAPAHWSGNFWWAKTNYLATLPDCGPNKFDAEAWVMLGNPTLKCLHDTGGMNHYYNEYPKERYRFHTS